MNPHLSKLQPYPFEKLARLTAGKVPPADQPAIALALGEPQEPVPPFIADSLGAHLSGLGRYPISRGQAELRSCIAAWLERRFGLPVGAVDPERQVLPCLGTREALFSFAQCVIDPARQPLVLMPNPFYQIYEGAALLAGAQPWYVNAGPDTAYQPDFDAVPDTVWSRCQLLYLCSPSNPSGAVLGAATQARLIELAERHDFVIASDECYSELYADETEPPPGLLQTAWSLGNTSFRRCIVFHSLSKRSSVPGLRSGFIAGDAEILTQYLRYRTYHGCAMSLPVQQASIAAWQDESHVLATRAAYRRKFDAVLEILGDDLDVQRPPGGFYLWPRTPVDDQYFAAELFAKYNVTVLPGSYLARTAHGQEPGRNHVRIALVANLADCVTAAQRIRDFLRFDLGASQPERRA